jgi:hypothetical protein
MTQYILLLRGGNDASANYTPEQVQQAIERYRVWAGQLHAQGKLLSAEKLRDDGGRVLRAAQGQVVVDGPFAETKETIGGYFVIQAADYDEAIALTRDCPALDEDGSVELREIEAM